MINWYIVLVWNNNSLGFRSDFIFVHFHIAGAKNILENYYTKSVELFETQLDKAERGKDMNKSFQLAQDIAEAYNNLGKISTSNFELF